MVELWKAVTQHIYRIKTFESAYYNTSNNSDKNNKDIDKNDNHDDNNILFI